MRNRVVTPSTLEFAMSFPVIVDELAKKVTVLPFHYYTRQHTFYEDAKNYLPIKDLKHILRQPERKLTDEELQLMDDYKNNTSRV